MHGIPSFRRTARRPAGGRRRPDRHAARRACQELERTFTTYRPYLLLALERRVGPGRARTLLAASYAELLRLAPRVPTARPGDWLRDNLYGAAAVLAVGRALRTDGFDDPTIAAIARETVAGRLDAYPPLVLRIMGRVRAARPYQHLLQRRATRSRRPEYPGEWVYDRVAGDGGSFAWGIDFRRCPILDLYRAERAEEMMAVVCPLDFTISERMGDGLVRTTTLASGGDRCDFRYGRPGGSRLEARAGRDRAAAS